MLCQPIRSGDAIICSACGRKFVILDATIPPERYYARCELSTPREPSTPRRRPGLARRVYSACRAAGRWVAAGMPVRTPERVDALFRICSACEHFAGTKCGVCGCPVNNDASTPRKNKLAMATESCPLEPPRWTADV